MKQYLDLLRDVCDRGEDRDDRTGVGTRSMFGWLGRYDLRKGFPIVTTKKVLFEKVVDELIWFLSGSTNVEELAERSQNVWAPWAGKNGNVGPIYGKQWRRWEDIWHGRGYVDQISNLIEGIKTNPMSRRHIVSSWNVAELYQMALPPCHLLFQCYVSNDGCLDLQLTQRSGDLAIGIPFNISSYCLLLAMLAQEVNLVPRYFVHSIGDAHIYSNHFDGVREQLTREPLPLPTLKLANKPVLEMTAKDIELENYQHHPFIKFPVAV